MDDPNPMFANRRATRPRLPLALQPLLICALLLTGVGCAAPSSQDRTAASEAAAIQAQVDDATRPAPAPVADSSTPPPPKAPPMSGPLPPEQLPGPAPEDKPAQVPASSTVKIDTSCTRDSDCAVKDVGNCCGYYPACVNVNSPTDPAAVQAQCAREGTMSICGFPAISACQCIAGQCQADTVSVER